MVTRSSAEMDRPAPAEGRPFFGQPRGLANLFGVEMWERFSFYGMQGILLLYMVDETGKGGLGIADHVATGIVGAYGGVVYLSTILGAWVADRLLGSERVLFASAVLIMFGHLSLALLPGAAGIGVGLAAIAFGSGGLKANATSMVGTLYAQDDPRRDAGFSLFYLGINLGAFAGPLLTGLLQTTLGYHYGFGLAAVGMAAGLVQYSFGRKNFSDRAREVKNPLPRGRRTRWVAIGAGAPVVLAALVLIGVITADNLADIVVYATIAATVALFALILSSRHISPVERRRVLAFIPLFIASAAFWSLYQQQFTVVPLYALDQLNRSLFGWQMPVSWVNAINPVYIIVFAGVFAAVWTKLGDRQPSTPVKFAAGTATMGLAFLLFLPFAHAGRTGTPLWVMAVIILVFSVAELLLSPIGLSLSTKLAPQIFRTQMVALFFLSVALGTAMSGVLAGYYDPADQAPYFGILGGVAIVVGAIVLLMAPFIRRLMSGVR